MSFLIGPVHILVHHVLCNLKKATPFKNKGDSKGSSGDAIEEPFFGSTKNHSVNDSLNNHLFLTFL